MALAYHWTQRRKRVAPTIAIISDRTITVAGVAYRSRTAAMKALKKLNPKELRFVPARGVSYAAVAATLAAYQRSGLRAHLGFVGNVGD